MSKKEEQIIRVKWQAKKDDAKRRKIDCTITFEQYIQMMSNANITEDMIGTHSNAYQLARYKDQGIYSIENCRFITRTENLKELFEHYDNNGVNNPMFGKKNPEHSTFMKEKMIGNKHLLGHIHTDETKRKMSESHSGEKNHFYGKEHSNESKKLISSKNKGKIPWNKGHRKANNEKT